MSGQKTIIVAAGDLRIGMQIQHPTRRDALAPVTVLAIAHLSDLLLELSLGEEIITLETYATVRLVSLGAVSAEHTWVRDARRPLNWVQWAIAPHLSNRWGELGAGPHSALVRELIANSALLATLQSSLYEGLSFIAYLDGRYGILFEIEFLAAVWPPGNHPDTHPRRKARPTHASVHARLLRGAAELQQAFPSIRIALPDERAIAGCRPTVWAFIDSADLVIDAEWRDTFVAALAAL